MGTAMYCFFLVVTDVLWRHLFCSWHYTSQPLSTAGRVYYGITCVVISRPVRDESAALASELARHCPTWQSTYVFNSVSVDIRVGFT